MRPRKVNDLTKRLGFLLFFISGTANIVVAYSFAEVIWVNFKLFGLIGLTLVFLILQAVWMTRRLQDEDLESDQRQQ